MISFLKKNMVWLALMLTLAACAWVKWQELNSEQTSAEAYLPAAKSSLSQASSSVGEPLVVANQTKTDQVNVLLRSQSADDAKINNLFTVYQPHQTAPAKQVATAPQVPANPYSYVGELIEDGNIKVFLTDGSNNHAVQLGDVLDGTWRVQAINQLAVSLMYLPMKTIITLPKGALN